jgi:general secretion pathway protein J
MSYGGLKSVIDSKNHVERLSNRYQQLDLVFLLMEQDFYQMISRPSRDEFGDSQAALISNSLSADFFIEFSRAGGLNLSNPEIPLMQRVAYVLQDGILTRRTWQVVDRLQSSTFQDVELIDRVEQVQVSFYYDDWKDQLAAQQGNVANALPRAIAVTLDVAEIGSIRRAWAVTL